ncbi:unnamed protein product [Pleuronectes platessa]|uniref:Uncharacterized protein n=1 Tax=Pleuronectes platessa TaxID=8262 RepID=A0A9N7VMA7_PLEPL|nr:unnamed protein product [Pleuronectes platessa]
MVMCSLLLCPAPAFRCLAPWRPPDGIMRANGKPGSEARLLVDPPQHTSRPMMHPSQYLTPPVFVHSLCRRSTTLWKPQLSLSAEREAQITRGIQMLSRVMCSLQPRLEPGPEPESLMA